MSNTEFLPPDYEIPKSPSNYTKFEKDTTTKVRILPSGTTKDTIIYWEYFDERWEKAKPVRSIWEFKDTPWIKHWRKAKEMWSLKVWNYDLEQVQMMQIWQVSIKEAIIDYYMNDNYWNPLWYDIEIKRTWEKLDTKYSVIANPPKEFDQSLLEWKDLEIDWAWFMECETDIFKKVDEE